MHVLRSVFTDNTTLRLSSIRDEVPTGLTLVSEKHVGTIVPSQPSPHLLGKVPHSFFRLFVDPVGHGTFQIITVSVNLTRELTLESWENIIEGESVSGKVNPARVCCKKSKSLTGPETLGVTPFCDIGALFLGIGSKILNIEVPVKGTTFLVQVLLKNTKPLLAVNVLFKGLVDLISVQYVKVKCGSKLDVASKLVPCLVVLVLKRTTFKLNNTSESV